MLVLVIVIVLVLVLALDRRPTCGRCSEPLSRIAAPVLLGLMLVSGCRGCQKSASSSTPHPSASSAAAQAAIPPPLEPLRFTEQTDMQGFGLPSGCKIELPIRHARLPDGSVRLSAARSELGQIALGVAAGDGGRVEHAGIVGGGGVTPLPWHVLDEPPLIDRAQSGWVTAWVSAGGEPERVVTFSHGGAPIELIRGDRLELSDLVCRGDRCLLLTSLARSASAPGATVLAVTLGSNAVERLDVEADPSRAFRPFSVDAPSASGAPARIALQAPDSTVLYAVRAGHAERTTEISTPFGVWDVIWAKQPLIVAPAASTAGPCSEDVFPIDIHTPGASEPRHLQVQARPRSVVARPLGNGGVIAWVAPVSCLSTTRSIVYLVLVAEDGAPVGAPMAVSDATGFALATDAERVSLFLRTERGLSWVRASCTVPVLRDH